MITERRNTKETELAASLTRYGIPKHMHGGVIRYVVYGIEPGHFLDALMSNDLKEAFGRADEENIAAMHAWIKWFYNEAPGTCWGSPERVDQWLKEEERP